MTTLCLLASCCLTAVSAPGTYWLEARDAQDGVTVEAQGTYAVWVWASKSAAELKVDDVTLTTEAIPKKDNAEWAWRKAGEAKLAAGAHPVQLSEGIAMIALSAAPEFDAAGAVEDRFIRKTPDAVRDLRSEQAKHTNTVFTMAEFASVSEWEDFGEQLRRRILLSSGLLPLPDKTPLKAKIFDRVQHDDYSVEKVHFEAYPGLLVTGNLYRPVGDGPFPGIICPHGHWSKGRLEDGERGSIPARGITLARMGAVVFMYDMIGYVDSKQFKHNWGGEAEKLWAIHPFAMQLWSSVRALDFMETLPSVDKDRLACTGASGGGTQTFALMAIDPRVKVSAPVNMISSRMQGGCLCENAPILRLANSNMEVGAMMAPRPMIMISATGDWTRETPRVEFPAIQSVYALYGAADRLENVHVDAGHNYNQDSREGVYRFFAKWLLGRDDYADFTEPPYELESDENLRVFPGDDAPKGYPNRDEVIASVIAERKAKSEKTLKENPALYKTVFSDIMDATVPGANDLDCERVSSVQRDDYVVEGWILRRKEAHDAVPALLYRAYDATPQDAVLLVHGEGKAALAGDSGPGDLVAGLLAQGKAVLAIDAFLVGEAHGAFAATERRREGGFMDTFQPTDTGYRVQDVLTAVAFLQARRDLTDDVDVVGLGAAGVWTLLARAIEAAPKGATVVDWNGFDPQDDEAWLKDYYVPCIRSVGDVQTAMALLDSERLTTLNAPKTARILELLN
jgi:hypothetical protein